MSDLRSTPRNRLREFRVNPIEACIPSAESTRESVVSGPDKFGTQSQDDAGLTRRRLLRLGLLAAGAGAVAIPAGTLGGYNLASAQGIGHTTGARQDFGGSGDPVDAAGLGSVVDHPGRAPGRDSRSRRSRRASLTAGTEAIVPRRGAPHRSARARHPAALRRYPCTAGRTGATDVALHLESAPCISSTSSSARSKGTHFARNRDHVDHRRRPTVGVDAQVPAVTRETSRAGDLLHDR